jgi:hypothetical protein
VLLQLPLGAPSSAEVADIARRTARRVHQAFQKKGRPSPWDDEHAVGDSGETDSFTVEQPGLFACYQAAAAGVAVSGERAGQPLLRLVAGDRAQPERSSDRAASSEPVAEALGVNRYAKQQVDGRDRHQLERLCRSVMRPPLSQERLQWRPDGRLELTLKNVCKDGTSALVVEPEDLPVRLCASIPPPWFNVIRYFGVLSSHSRYRARVVPSVVEPSRFAPEAASGAELELGFGFGSGHSSASASASRPGRSRWGLPSIALHPGLRLSDEHGWRQGSCRCRSANADDLRRRWGSRRARLAPRSVRRRANRPGSLKMDSPRRCGQRSQQLQRRVQASLDAAAARCPAARLGVLLPPLTKRAVHSSSAPPTAGLNAIPQEPMTASSGGGGTSRGGRLG